MGHALYVSPLDLARVDFAGVRRHYNEPPLTIPVYAP